MRKLWLSLALVAVLTAAAFMLLHQAEPDWTTDSVEARTHFELGLEAQMKFYEKDAQAHFERAIELDANFAAAKLALLMCCTDGEKREELIEELRGVDQAEVSDRERFLLQYRLAEIDRDLEKRQQVLQSYLESHPRDSFALWIYSTEAWRRQDLEEAEKRYRRLLKVDPNWVIAQNNLGYIAMARGRFSEAEQLFETYKYIAPDQANPHDSLGELLTLIGRYDDARKELEKALAIKPDFCASYRHLLSIVVLEGPLEDGHPIIERASAHCSQDDVERMRCHLSFWEDFIDGNFEGPWQEGRADCLATAGDFDFLLHRMEVLTGRLDDAVAREGRIREKIAELERQTDAPVTLPRGVLHFLEGARLVAQGAFDDAATRFDEADVNIVYFGDGQGILKLYNRLHLAYALERSGHQESARRVIASVEEVNPRLARVYPEIRELLDRPSHR